MGSVLDLLRAEYTFASYPIFVYYVVALVGLILLFIRPWWAFLFSVFCLSAKNFHAAVFTRTLLLGPYVNLNDLLVWICLFSMVMELAKYRRKLRFPFVLFLVCAVVFMGDLQSLYKYGLIEEVMRRLWGTAVFPIMFLIGTNMVRNNERAKEFFWVFFGGIVVASVQHIIGAFLSAWYLGPSLHNIKIISYLANGGKYVFVASMFFPMRKIINNRRCVYYYYSGLILIGTSLLFSFVRGLWVSILLSLFILPILLYKRLSFSKFVIRVAVAAMVLIILSFVPLKQVRTGEIIKERISSIMPGESFSESYESRELGLNDEIRIWQNAGSLIWGTGATLPLEYESSDISETGALYHVGYASYLSHYGLLGFLVYALILPIMSLSLAKKYYLTHSEEYGGCLVLMGLSCIIIDAIGQLSGTQYLWAVTHIQGLLYGAIWGLGKYFYRRYSYGRT